METRNLFWTQTKLSPIVASCRWYAASDPKQLNMKYGWRNGLEHHRSYEWLVDRIEDKLLIDSSKNRNRDDEEDKPSSKSNTTQNRLLNNVDETKL